MNRILSIGKLLVTNKVVQYISSRYFTYLLQFVNSIFIAVLLGPFYLGVWGFINLIVQYFAQINFGIPHAANSIIAIEKENTKFSREIFNNSISMVSILSILVMILFGINDWLNLGLGSKYEFSTFSFLVASIIALNYFIPLFSNIYRIEGKLFEIAFSQSCQTVLNIFTIIFFKGEALLYALVWTNLIAFTLVLILFIFNNPYEFKLSWNLKYIKLIQIKGWYLFIYNSSFYLIVISTRSVVSSYYSVLEFGYFTFAFTLANAVLLLFQSFASLIYPKLLNRFSKLSGLEGKKLIDRIRISYISFTHLFGHIIILIFPIFIEFFPKYSSTLIGFRFITLAILITTNTFGYQSLLIAKGEEKLLSKHTFFALIINISLALVLVKLNFSYQYIIISTMVAMLYLSFFICKNGSKQLGQTQSITKTFSEVFPTGILVPYVSSILLLVINADNIYFILPFILFIIFNINNLRRSYSIIIDIIKRPDMINF